MLGFIASVLIFPKSATGTALSELRNALKAAADLHMANWEVLQGSSWVHAAPPSILRPSVIHSGSFVTSPVASATKVRRSLQRPLNIFTI